MNVKIQAVVGTLNPFRPETKETAGKIVGYQVVQVDDQGRAVRPLHKGLYPTPTAAQDKIRRGAFDSGPGAGIERMPKLIEAPIKPLDYYQTA